MIDPNNITELDASRFRLEEQLLFWICVAGKKASTISARLEILFKSICKYWEFPEEAGPFNVIRGYLALKNTHQLAKLMKECGIGCYNLKAESWTDLVSRDIDLKTCSVADLEDIKGIGPKTARCFIMHTRKDAQVAGLDTHVLKFLRALGYDVPKQTPPSGKRYQEVEQMFLELCEQSGRTPAVLDLLVWRVYSTHPHLEQMLLDFFLR